MSEIPVNKFRLLVNEFRDSINYLRKQSTNVFSKSKIPCKKITGIQQWISFGHLRIVEMRNQKCGIYVGK